MADSKQYIEQMQDNGSILISEDVVATIATHAIQEVEGVAGLNGKPGTDIADLIGKKSWSKGIKITISEGNEITVECNVNIVYGQSVVSVAQAVQSAVHSAVESMTGVPVVSVNVNVCGIVRQ